ncbi:MAG: hypothetical protein JW705_05475, partial [Methanosarcinaceae archaeon]|nr:hypothetical protein [Methanosarcinaceae archaeon]
EEQYRSAGYIATEEADTHILASLLSARTDEFEYTFKPAEITGLNITFPEGTILDNAENTLYRREQKHRTFADIIAEDLILGMTLEKNGSTVYINPMAWDHPVSTEDAIREYLDPIIGERYRYRFEAHWHLVSGYGIGSRIEIGEEPPVNSFRQCARISLPLSCSPSRKEFFDSMNNSVLLDAIISSNPEKELREGYKRSIEAASLAAAEAITTIVFPAGYLESPGTTYNSSGNSSGSGHLSLISGPDNISISDPRLMIGLHNTNYIANEVFGLGTSVPLEDKEISPETIYVIENRMIGSNLETISAYLKQDMSDEIDQTVSGIMNATDYDTRIALHEAQMDSIYSRVNTGGADIILFLW